MSGAQRVAVVTGANRGVGREVVRQLAGRGYQTILGSRDLAKGQLAAAELEADGAEGVLARQLDVTDSASVDRLAAELTDNPGHLDVLVNNAAIHYDSWQRQL